MSGPESTPQPTPVDGTSGPGRSGPVPPAPVVSPPIRLRFLILLAEGDRVAAGLARFWGTPPATGARLDGVPIREMPGGFATVRRPGVPSTDDRWPDFLPSALRNPPIPVILPSVHRSRGGVRSFTVHPLGSWGIPRAGGSAEPLALVPTAPRLMAATLRLLAESAGPTGVPASYEATHHGPFVAHPCFFIEIGGGPGPEGPTPEELAVLAASLAGAVEDPRDRIAIGVGGGHYVPHFTELALRRQWAFGHLLPRHVLESLTSEGVRAAWATTPGAEGILCARAVDRTIPAWAGVGPMLKDSDAPKRSDPPHLRAADRR